MVGVNLRKYDSPFKYDIIFSAILVTRFISEMITNFFWRPANYVWSILVLVAIPVVFWPYMVLKRYAPNDVLKKYWPVFLYIFYIILRVNFFEIYSLKCFLSEFIVWFLFIFSLEVVRNDVYVARTIQTIVIHLVKIVIVLGLSQMFYFMVSSHAFNLSAIFIARPVKGVFAHPNIFLVVVLPFLFYFLNLRNYFWFVIGLIACIGTGTRSPFLTAVCLLPLLIKLLQGKEIKWRTIFITLLILVGVYGIMIFLNTFRMQDYIDNSRFNAGTLRWRISFWQNFIYIRDAFTGLFGNGVGSADILAAKIIGKDMFYPHSDFVRIFYDMGFVGVLFTVSLVIFMLRMIRKVLVANNAFILLIYLMIIGFYISDNFIYFTHSIFSYMFIASFLVVNEDRPLRMMKNFS